MASNKYVVYITYGVYVDVDNTFDLASDEDNFKITAKAVEKLFEHGIAEVISACDAEIEDVTEEFNNA